jgi:translation initiation factor IF-2
VSVNYIELGVGNITESDIKIASTASATIFGFGVDVTPVAKRLAEDSGVNIKIYKIIYELVEEVKKMMGDLLPVEIIRTDLGKLQVLAIFKTGKRDMIVGGRVIDGKMAKGALIEVKRGEEIIGQGKIQNSAKQGDAEVKQEMDDHF